ncbi:hypothetical protein HU200_022638 [Digitaria exilis]|uniref:Uncharacterized protein n=1 Tax=Digitaria exilis TaxID=1010633 RepID=A0A835C4Q7_9POAL|nr:hypothetical protein HU200_022638 [Digitaria exilis]
MSSSRRWTSASITELPAAGRSSLLPPAGELSPGRHTARRSVSRSDTAPATSIARTIWPSSSSFGGGKSGKITKATRAPSPLSSSSPSSSSSSSVATLADHLAKDDTPHSVSRQRSCTELPRFASDTSDAEPGRKIGRSTGNGGHAFGRSMRLLPSTKPAGVTLTPGRVAPSDLRRLAANNGGGLSLDAAAADAASSGSECSDASTRGSASATSRTAVSNSKPHSPLLPRTSSVRLLGSSTTHHGGAGEVWHEMRMAHCRLLQWRYANAKAEAVRKRKKASAELELMGAWASVSEMRGKVARKRVQLEKEKQKIKLNTVLTSQMKDLESWGQVETEHATALASTVSCTRAAVCRLPLTNGAKVFGFRLMIVSLPPLSTILQQALELTLTAKTITRSFSPKDTALVISDLVRVATEEKVVLEECLELLSRVSALQVEEQSLRCHLVQSASLGALTVECTQAL